MENWARSDLATECGAGTDGEWIRVLEREVGRCKICRIQVRDEAAAVRIGKPVGRYVVLECGEISGLDEPELDEARRALSVEIREMAERMTGRRVSHGFSVLVAGLGNRSVTPDAIGPETVKRLSVTRHLRQFDSALFSTVGLCEISAVVPGVLGETGVASAELVKSAVLSVQPDLVIAVDALAARAVERLAATVQLSDTGICPGSGLGEGKWALNRETIGVPVMALGVPTVVESATLVADVLAANGRQPDAAVQPLQREGKRFFVAPKEIDVLVAASGVLLAGAIERAFRI